MGIIIAIAVITGLITIINVLGSIVLASDGKRPQVGGESALVFVLVMYLFVGWWTVAIGLFILLLWAFIVGLYEKNTLSY